MRKQPVKHEKHERRAIAAFIITLAIAIMAFYYAYQQNAQYGKTIQGLESFAASTYCREQQLTRAQCAVALANVQIVQAQISNSCIAYLITKQNKGDCTRTPVCTLVSKIKSGYSEDYSSEGISGDKAICRWYVDNILPHRKDGGSTEAVYVGESERCIADYDRGPCEEFPT